MTTPAQLLPHNASPTSTMPAHPNWTLAALILGSGIVFLDSTVVNVALPHIQREFNASLGAVAWIVDAYTLLLAALLLIGGALGDILGRRRMFLTGLVIFAVASALCGLAPSLGLLIAARVLQGIGGALLVPESLAILNAVFPPGRRGQAIGTWAAFSGVTSAVGPLLGGYLVDAASWRWAFLINLPLAAVTFVVMVRAVPETRNEDADPHIDWLGAISITAGLGGVIFALLEGAARGWGNPLIVAALGIGVSASIAFVFIEARGAHPMLPLSLFRSRQFSGTNLATLAIYFAFNGALLFLVLYLQQVQHASAFLSGVSLVPITLVLLLLSRTAGSIADRVGLRLPMTIGPLLVSAGFLLMLRITPNASYVGVILPALLVLSLGMVLTITPLTTAAMSSVEVRHSGTASGVNNSVSRIAAALAIAVLTLLATARFGGALETHLATLHLGAATHDALMQQADRLGAISVPTGISGATAGAVRQAIADAFTDAFRLVVLTCAALALLGGVISFLTIPGKQNVPAAGEAQPRARGAASPA